MAQATIVPPAGMRSSMMMADLRTVLIERKVLVQMQTTAEAADYRHEVGGVLLGCYRGPHIHIQDATRPQARDRFSFASFVRDSFGHQSLAARAWRRSGGITTYVGEWHSHPEGVPTPSSIDRASWNQKVSEQCRDLVFLIQGWNGIHVEAADHLGRRRQLYPREGDANGVLFGSLDRS